MLTAALPCCLLCAQLLLQPLQLQPQLHVGASQLFLALPCRSCSAHFTLEVRLQLVDVLRLAPDFILQFVASSPQDTTHP